LQLGLLTVQDFLNYCGEVMTDFLTKTGIAKKIVCLNVQAGINTYFVPNQVSDLQYANYDQGYLHHTSTFYVDNSYSQWASATGVPVQWRQDEIQTKQVALNPTPDIDGNQIDSGNTAGFYGVISSTLNANDINLTGPPTGLYGVVNGFSGGPYWEAINPGYGILSAACCSPTNLELIATALPSTLQVTLASYLELIPESFAPAIRYGVLARIYSQDGECKDLVKANFCQAKASEYINLASSVMSELFEQESDNG
jgi:hypothetical protein